MAPTAENYKSCYDLLASRYNNKRETLGNLIDAMLNLPKSNMETSAELRKIHDTTNESMMAIQNLGFDTTSWDPLVSHIISKKLSKDTIKHYECSLSDVKET